MPQPVITEVIKDLRVQLREAEEDFVIVERASRRAYEKTFAIRDMIKRLDELLSETVDLEKKNGKGDGGT